MLISIADRWAEKNSLPVFNNEHDPESEDNRNEYVLEETDTINDNKIDELQLDGEDDSNEVLVEESQGIIDNLPKEIDNAVESSEENNSKSNITEADSNKQDNTTISEDNNGENESIQASENNDEDAQSNTEQIQNNTNNDKVRSTPKKKRNTLANRKIRKRNKKVKATVIKNNTKSKASKSKADSQETAIVPCGNEEDYTEILVNTPKNNNIHLCYVQNMNKKNYHPENKINQNKNVIVLQIPENYLTSKKPSLKDAAKHKKELIQHNPHMKTDGVKISYEEVYLFDV